MSNKGLDMIHIAVRVRELVSSNIDAIVAKATDPTKALGLLRAEVEETLISLHSELSMTKRQHERTARYFEKLSNEAEAWTGKAQIAVDHGREDLAKAALNARQEELERAASVKDEAAQLADQVAQFEKAIGELETKRTAIAGQLSAGAGAHQIGRGRKQTDRRFAKIEELERRLAFQTQRTDAEAEIESISQDALIEAELKAMKARNK